MNITLNVNGPSGSFEGRILQPGDIIPSETVSIFTPDEESVQKLEQMVIENLIELDDFTHRPVKKTLVGRPVVETAGRLLVAPLTAQVRPSHQTNRKYRAKLEKINENTRLIFIGGRWGSGKDTLAKAIAYDHPENNFVILRNKDYYRNENGKFMHGEYNKNDADRRVAADAAVALAEGNSVIIVDYLVVPQEDIAMYKTMIAEEGDFTETYMEDLQEDTLVFTARAEFEAKDNLPAKVKETMTARRAEAHRKVA